MDNSSQLRTDQERKGVKTVKYQKPEVVAVATAHAAIQGGKANVGIFEGVHERYLTPNAYEADE